MSGEKSITDLEELMQHTSWIRNLAYANLRDYALAEDVSQEVLLKALAGPRRTGQVLKAWLAAVTFNTAKNEIRGNSRRRAREAKVAQRNSGTVEANQLDIMQTHRELTYVVEALSPKHREIIVLRFYEEHSFRQIGALLNTSESTARVRLHRALQEMRNTIKQSGGDWKASCSILAPFASFPQIKPAIPFLTKLLGLAAAVAFIATAAWWQATDDKTQPALGHGQAIDVASLEPQVSDFEPEVGRGSIIREDFPAPSLVEEAVSSVDKVSRSGRVFHNGIPVEGAEVRVWQADEILSSSTDSEGFFQVPISRSSSASVTALFNGMATKEFVPSGSSGHLVIDLIDAAQQKPWPILISDLEANKPIPGASVQVFIDWSGLFNRGGMRLECLELIAEGETDSSGEFFIPLGYNNVDIFVRANASGYLPNQAGGYQVHLTKGDALPVQLVFEDGSPASELEIRVGGGMQQAARTDADGFLPVVRNWRRRYRKEPNALPSFILMKLSGDQIWVQGSDWFKEEHVTVLHDRIQLTVAPVPIQVEMVDFLIPEGAWVEARSWASNYPASFLGSDPSILWQRLVPGATVELDKGIVGHLSEVEAKMMPGGLPLGRFRVRDGKATIDKPIGHLKLSLEGDSVESGHALNLLIDSVPGVKIPIVAGLAEVDLPFGSGVDYWCSIENVNTGEKSIFRDQRGHLMTSVRVFMKEQNVEATIREESSHMETVLIKVDGFAVQGGEADSVQISQQGEARIPFDENGKPMLRGLKLRLPIVLHSQSGGPILSAWGFMGDSELPGRLHATPDGKRIWDFQLAQVELLLPTGTREHEGRIDASSSPLSSYLLWPPQIRGRDLFLIAPEAGGWFSFRVPAGHYKFKVQNGLTFGGPDGVDFPAGQITQLHPDVVDPPVEGEQ